MDEEALQKLLGPDSVVCTYEGDGAKDEQGAGKALKTEGLFENQKFVTREKAHTAIGVLKTVHDGIPVIRDNLGKILLGKESVIRRLDKSDVLSKFYVQSQEKRQAHLPKKDRTIIKGLCMAPQRFNSCCDPAQKYCMTILDAHDAVAKGAHHWNGTSKQADVNEMVEVIKEAVPEMHLGCAADAGSALDVLVRFFDDAHWLKSDLIGRIAAVRDMLHNLFAKGYVLDEVLGAHTFTQKIIRNMSENHNMFFGTKAVTIQKITASKIMTTVLKDWQAWRILFEEELDAEFPAFEALQTFVIFNLGEPASLLRGGKEELRDKVHKFAKVFALPEEELLIQWAEVREQAVTRQAQDRSLSEDQAWRDAFLYFDRKHLRKTHKTGVARDAFGYNTTVTGSSCGIEHLFIILIIN